jgi:hypothetical protein
MRTHWSLLFILLSLALGSCGPAREAGGQPSGADPFASIEFPSPEPTAKVHENPIQLGSTPESEDMPLNPPPVEKYIALAKADLAVRLQIEAGEISVLKTAEIVWPDAALGCPDPGMVYAQGRVPGYQIRLMAQSMEYDYHTDLHGQVILCLDQGSGDLDSGKPPSSSPTPHIGVPID